MCLWAQRGEGNKEGNPKFHPPTSQFLHLLPFPFFLLPSLSPPMEFVRYKHARFSARFPARYRYSPSHYWMASGPGRRAGCGASASPSSPPACSANSSKPSSACTKGDPVAPGQEIGWVEGFKAASDVYCVMEGAFVGGEPGPRTPTPASCAPIPILTAGSTPCADAPENGNLDVHAYVDLLDETITRMQAQEEHSPDQRRHSLPTQT